MRGLNQKCFIVTGAASGIGWACANRLIEEGARVMGSDLVQPAVNPSGFLGVPTC
jgi:NAD(P)-dependent dehydrogenase (short-subunit alcohol dehydrogenase family)